MFSPFQQMSQKSCISLTFLSTATLQYLPNNGVYRKYEESNGTLEEN